MLYHRVTYNSREYGAGEGVRVDIIDPYLRCVDPDIDTDCDG